MHFLDCRVEGFLIRRHPCLSPAGRQVAQHEQIILQYNLLKTALGSIGIRIAALFLCSLSVLQSAVYVSPTGSDSNPGTFSQPYKTILWAVASISAGDTIFVRGGTYVHTGSINIATIGTSDKKCVLFAYPGDSPRPLLDFSSMAVSSSNQGIILRGNYWHIKGLDIKGAGDNGMQIRGSHNIVEFCSFYENRDTGLQLDNGASHNRIINCDSYFNADPSNGNADGFAPKLTVGTGNYFYGCRAWQNSDDGWDGYLRPADSVFTTIENSWCFRNGYLKNGTASTGNGNGYKMGGGDNTNADSLRHHMTLINCLAFDNRVKGFDQNNNRGSMTLLNCTSFRNSTNYQISARLKSGSVLTVKNSISVSASGNSGSASLLSTSIQATNSWTPPFTFTAADFLTIDTAGIRGPRQSDGSLPNLQFLRPSSISKFIDAGTDVGLPFNGKSPDLGAFESDFTINSVPRGIVPAHFQLLQNYPNPFNPKTTIAFSMPTSGFASLKVYDILGKEVVTLAHGNFEGGVVHERTFHGSSMSSGIYIAQLSAGGEIRNIKMSMMK